MDKILPMARFEPRIPCFGGDRSANCATTTTLDTVVVTVTVVVTDVVVDVVANGGARFVKLTNCHRPLVVAF